MITPLPYTGQENPNRSTANATPSAVSSTSQARGWTPGGSRAKKISQDELNDFTERQMGYIQQKKSRMRNLEAKYYHGDGNHLHHDESKNVITNDALEKSVARQYEQEMQQRENKKKELEKKYAPSEPKFIVVDSETEQDIARRLYERSILIKEKLKRATAEKQRQIEEDAKKVEKGRKMGKEDIKTMGNRLCTTKKKLTYEEEMKKIFGPNVQIPEKYKAAARRIEEQEEEVARSKKRLE